MKKVLILTYYWPPSGGIGVQRWLQFARHLPENGWEPIIFTAKDANYPIIDQSLLERVPKGIEIHSVKAPEPNNIISLFFKNGDKSKGLYQLQQQSNTSTSPLKKLLWTIRGNFFIPDARMLWIGKSFKYLDSYLSENKVDAIISTGPPHSTHIIAQKINAKYNIPWISDFRDPWTSMDYLKKMNLKKFALRKHERLEKGVLQRSTHVMVVGKTIQNEFKEKYNIDSSIVYNGYSLTQTDSEKPVELDAKFTIVHTGSFLHNRNCNDLWSCLSDLVKADQKFASDLEIKLVGNVAPVVRESLEKYDLVKFTNFISHVDHNTAKTIQRSAQTLLLPIDRIENAEFVLTGKLFEYLQARRPILCIGPSKGDAADVIRSCSAGTVVDFDDTESLKRTIVEIYQKYCNSNNGSNSVGIEKYSYPELTKNVVVLLNNSIHD